MKRAYLNRGLPGSGKSFRAGVLRAECEAKGLWVVVCSSDDYFVCPSCGAYHWRRDALGAAHIWCQDLFAHALADGADVVIVDNTNVTARECRFYVEMALLHGYEVVFLEPRTAWAFDLDELARRNVHGVPREGLERMLRRWQPDMTVAKALAGLPQGGAPHPDEAATRP